jgi:hypothetical protein
MYFKTALLLIEEGIALQFQCVFSFFSLSSCALAFAFVPSRPTPRSRPRRLRQQHHVTAIRATSRRHTFSRASASRVFSCFSLPFLSLVRTTNYSRSASLSYTMVSGSAIRSYVRQPWVRADSYPDIG